MPDAEFWRHGCERPNAAEWRESGARPHGAASSARARGGRSRQDAGLLPRRRGLHGSLGAGALDRLDAVAQGQERAPQCHRPSRHHGRARLQPAAADHPIQRRGGEPFTQRLYDPGVTRFSIQVRDIDFAFARVKDRGIVVDTTSAGPVFTQRPRNNTRAVMMRDPDGFVFEFVQPGAPPETDVPATSNVFNARSSLAVDNMERALTFYRDLLGFTVSSPPNFINDAVLVLEGTLRAKARTAQTMPPGSNNMWVIWEFSEIERTRRAPAPQDPGASAISLEVENLAALLARLARGGVTVETPGPSISAAGTTEPWCEAPTGCWSSSWNSRHVAVGGHALAAHGRRHSPVVRVGPAARPRVVRHPRLDARHRRRHPVVGLLTLAQAPWTFKVLWAPLMDRYVPPFWGRRRGWMALTQVALACPGPAARRRRRASRGDLGRRGAGARDCDRFRDAGHRDRRLRRRGAADGGAGRRGRGADGPLSRGDARLRRRLNHAGGPHRLARGERAAGLCLPADAGRDVARPEPERRAAAAHAARRRLAAVLGLLRATARSRSWRSSSSTSSRDHLAQSLTRPFLIDMGYGAGRSRIALATLSVVGSRSSARSSAGWSTTLRVSATRSGSSASCRSCRTLGYFLLASGRPQPVPCTARPASRSSRPGWARARSRAPASAHEKRFSATQYALFSSLFALPRSRRPDHRVPVDAIGWPSFFLLRWCRASRDW